MPIGKSHYLHHKEVVNGNQANEENVRNSDSEQMRNKNSETKSKWQYQYIIPPSIDATCLAVGDFPVPQGLWLPVRFFQALLPLS